MVARLNYAKKGLIICLLSIVLVLLLSSCLSPSHKQELQEEGQWLLSIQTDKARYSPEQAVQFSLGFKPNKSELEGTLLIRYRHLNTIVEEQVVAEVKPELQWSWTPPLDDYRGYMVEVLYKNDKTTLDQLTIAVDVSSTWDRFPRYGYLADFHLMSLEDQEATIAWLNRLHLNGIQFYDWQYSHHSPLKLENGKIAESWPDIANRKVSRETLINYLELAKERNMTTMHYNLIFGAYEGAEDDGVQQEWGLYTDAQGQIQDRHPLPESWASDIMLLNPANAEWQQYAIQAQRKVFESLPFDGWHMDQLGDRGTRWTYEGERLDLHQTYASFIESAYNGLGVDLVFNAVDQYAQASIAASPVKFLYTEVWGMTNYRNLKEIIDQNLKYSKGTKNTVLAAYVNYDLANSRGMFNTPGVLLANAVIFASGGAHIELGENMLAKEYFPNKNLKIPEQLRNELIHYYDFLTAYQNVLRDQLEPVEVELTSDEVKVRSLAQRGAIWSFAKAKDKQHIVQLINFVDAKHMEWKDAKGTQSEPEQINNLPLTLTTDQQVKSLWMASPDTAQGTPISIQFKQKGNEVKFTLPSIKYWSMLVIEYE